MRIRYKLIILEVVVATILFLSLLASILAFADFLALENLKIRAESLRQHAELYRFATLGIRFSDEDPTLLEQRFRLSSALFDDDLEKVISDTTFPVLPPQARDIIEDIDREWAGLTGSDVTTVIQNALLARKRAPGDLSSESLSGLMARLEETGGENTEIYYQAVSASGAVIGVEIRILSFLNALEVRMDDFLRYARTTRRQPLLIAILVPLMILAVAMGIVVVFGMVFARRLNTIVDAVGNVAGGDFTTRVDLKGKDEFGALSSNLNVLTETLGSRLETFRLIMHDVGRSIGSGMDSAQVEETIVSLAYRNTTATGAALYKVIGDAGELGIGVIQGEFRPPFALRGDAVEDPDAEDMAAILRGQFISPGSTIIGEVAVSGQAAIIRETGTDKTIDWRRDTRSPYYLHSVMALPLLVGNTVLGVLVLVINDEEVSFNDLEYANMQSFAELAAITLDNLYKYAEMLEATQLNREIDIAEEIQKDLRPKKLPRLEKIKIHFGSRTLKGLNGDFFDVFPLGRGKTMLTICEVAGRGVPAGLVMVMIRTILRLSASPDKDAAGIMTQLNRDMTRRIAIENFASVGILVINDRTGEFSFSSAAHYPMQILRSGREVFEEFQTEGIPVGIDRSTQYEQVESRLEPGDLALLYTDGVPEARNRSGQDFGIGSLLDTILANTDEEPENIVAAIKTELELFERGTNQKDDQTLMVLKYTGGSAA